MTPEARLASSPQDTLDGTVAYARFAAPRAIPYRTGLLPNPAP